MSFSTSLSLTLFSKCFNVQGDYGLREAVREIKVKKKELSLRDKLVCVCVCVCVRGFICGVKCIRSYANKTSNMHQPNLHSDHDRFVVCLHHNQLPILECKFGTSYIKSYIL